MGTFTEYDDSEFEEFAGEAGARLLAREETDEDQAIDLSLRPQSFDGYIGQEKIKEDLKISIEAAKYRGDTLNHVLLYGPPGLGKTTLSAIIANELGVNLQSTSGPAIEKAGDLAAYLTSLSKGDVLFIDEIHRLPRTIEEILYSAMEDSYIDIFIGKGPAARSIRMPLKPFTLIGATTRAGQLSAPLRDRFGLLLRLEPYTKEELTTIVLNSAGILDVPIERDGAEEIAGRSRGTPRIANRLLRLVRDFAQVRGNGVITREIADMALGRLDIDGLGLDRLDRRMLETIIRYYDGGPVGLKTLAATVGEEEVTLEDAYEPYLMQIGFLSRTSKGRMATRLAYEHLGIPFEKKIEKKIEKKKPEAPGPRGFGRAQIDIFADDQE